LAIDLAALSHLGDTNVSPTDALAIDLHSPALSTEAANHDATPADEPRANASQADATLTDAARADAAQADTAPTDTSQISASQITAPQVDEPRNTAESAIIAETGGLGHNQPPAELTGEIPSNETTGPGSATESLQHWLINEPVSPPTPVAGQEGPTANNPPFFDGSPYLDRELSWLAFNGRVLDLAKDRLRVPLLERARFLAIFSGNLDEFFMVRVGGLKRRIEAGMAQPGTSGLLPSELHDSILSSTRDLVAEQGRIFTAEIRPELAQAGISILHWDELTEAERERLDALFRDRIFPILTPLAIDPSHPFPHLSARALNLIVQEQNPQTGVKLFARVKVPDVLPRFYRVSENRYVPLEDILISHQDKIFGMTVLHSTICRVTRDEDVEVEEDDAENILFALEKEIDDRRRPGRPPVRLEISEGTAPVLMDFLLRELDITPQETFTIRGPLDLRGLFAIADVKREDLKYPGFLPKTNPQLTDWETSRPADLFDVLKKREVLLHHPYDSFSTSVQRFIEQAASDPQVKLIRQTLYRTSGDSPIIDALIEAAQSGKEVLTLIEIKARFDERANIRWARKLERAGVHVVYGIVGLKTHCKLALVIREEEDGTLRRYCHVGTGNYNPKTARQYEDMGLLTSDPVITADVHQLFNSLASATVTSAAAVTSGVTYRNLLVSPHGIREGLINAINQEIEFHRQGQPARIRIKVNSIVDEQTMDALYRASQAGVPVDLWVRGICALRAGVPQLSENIRVRSILGRFLEHSRLFWFEHGGQPIVGIGSADLMHRNLDRRVEVMVQLNQPSHHKQVGHLFDLAFDDQVASWWLTPQGWVQRTASAEGVPLIDIQQQLITEMAARHRPMP
jgi:polyphosphate kinase